jgi:hypothetical protein
VAAHLFLSGLFNCYGTIPFAFSADVKLEGLGTLSDALICCRGHDRYAIVAEKRLLLTGAEAEAEADAYPKQRRRTTVNRLYEAFELTEAEIKIFREKPYFYRRSHELSSAESDDDSDPDPDSGENGEVRAYGFEEPEAREANIDIDKT